MRTKKSAINKINSQIKKPHLKMFPIKDKNNNKFNCDMEIPDSTN